MWRKLPRRSRARSGNLGHWCSDCIAPESSGCDAGRGQKNRYFFFSQMGRGSVGADSWRPPGHRGPCIKRPPIHLLSGAVCKAIKLPREPLHRAKPPYSFSPPPGLCGLGTRSWVGAAAAQVWTREEPPQPQARILSLSSGREPFLDSSLSSGTGPFRAIMSHKALAPRGVSFPRRGDARGAPTRR